MSVTTFSRQASVDEITAEMDRRGEVIERLEAELHALREALTKCSEAKMPGAARSIALAALSTERTV